MSYGNKYNYNNMTDNFKGSNRIIQAYENNQTGCELDISPNNPFRLHRFKKKYNIAVTGKEIGNKYVIVFWDRLSNHINHKQKENNAINSTTIN
tara:strand:+ start:4777 stop:5058 length:282 start_codon:yes stop_codon:yes gene_type:complete